MFNSPCCSLALIAVIALLCGCRPAEKPPAPTPPKLPVQAPAPADRPHNLDIFPFPEHFSIARRDLNRFSGTVRVDDEKRMQRLRIIVYPVMSQRFGCYTLDTNTKWEGNTEDFCRNTGSVFDRGGRDFRFGTFLFHPLQDDAEFPSKIISVWKIRGDSLDFYTILNQYFSSEGQNTDLQIDSIRPLSSKQNYLYAHLTRRSEKKRANFQPWTAIWTLPNKLEIKTEK